MTGRKSAVKPVGVWACGAVGVFGIGALLALISNLFGSLDGWLSFVVVLLLSAGLFALVWRTLRSEKPPRWLLYLSLGAILFRLALGVVWFLGLPAWGYDTDVQNHGYVMEDAYNRDVAAWDFAQSDDALIEAFRGYSATDQYGGLLFLSAAFYRYVSGSVHQPLLILVLCSLVSGLAVAFTWASANRAFKSRVAWLAAWGLALYPEAVLLGSSQMREAFTVCLVPMILLGVQQLLAKPRRTGLALLLTGFALAAFFSWPFVSSLLLLTVLAYLSLTKWRLLRNRRVWIVAGGLGLAALVYLFAFTDTAQLWLVQSARWQAYVSANASGWVARQFERMPLSGQVPFLMSYGIFRPLLPAAIAAGGPAVWIVIGVWRALGWTALLAMLVYASYLALRSRGWRELPGALLLSNWVVSFVASYRGGGDLWDSPRYRSAFAAAQLTLAAWAWVSQQRSNDPWLRRAAVSAVLLSLWFVPWYLRRYVGLEWWPLVEIYQVIGVGLATCVAYIFWDWMRRS
jgi:hypothetical protein